MLSVNLLLIKTINFMYLFIFKKLHKKLKYKINNKNLTLTFKFNFLGFL